MMNVKSIKVSLVEGADEFLQKSIENQENKICYVIGNKKKNINVEGYLAIDAVSDYSIYKFNLVLKNEDISVEEVDLDLSSKGVYYSALKNAIQYLQGLDFSGIVLNH